MKKKNLNKIESLVVPVIERLEKLEKFTIDQLPDLAKEILKAYFFENMFYGITGIIGGLSLTALITWLSFYLVARYGDAHAYGVLMVTPISLIWFINGTYQITEAIKVKISPKLTVLKELKKLIK